MPDDIETRAKEIAERILRLPTSARAEAVVWACTGDSFLRTRVRALVDAGGVAEETIDAPPDTEKAMGEFGERPGNRIGRYRLQEELGQGGFGVVFLAEQEQPVRRQVALKVIKLGMDTREVVARFDAERQALAIMDHPNVAKVLDAGATDSGRPYFVMEFVRGSPITDFCDKHRLGLARRVELMAQVCRAVQHAHSKGIIHRDLKPSNVLVTVGDNGEPVPKVIDFGIAKAMGQRLTDRTLQTAIRQMIGTPQYMSPEQADSEGVDVDIRTDVYSLGVMLYELLVGTTPLDARVLRSAAFEAMRKLIRDTDPDKPSTRLLSLGDAAAVVATARGTDPGRLAQVVRGELDWIVMKSLEKDRARRYDTAAAFADDLVRHLTGEVVLAGPVSGTYRLRKALWRHRTAVTFGGAIAACLLLGVAGTSWGLVRAEANAERATAGETEARRQRAAADTSAGEARRQQELAEGQRQEALSSKKAADEKSAEAYATLDFLLHDVLGKASPKQTKNAALSQTLVDALIVPATKNVDRRFSSQPLIRANVQNVLAATLIDLGRPDLAEPQAKLAWDASRKLLGDEHAGTLKCLNNYAVAIDGQGRRAEAERLYKQCWDAERRVSGEESPESLDALCNYGNAIREQGRYTDAERLEKLCWDARRRVLGENDPATLAALNSYANAVLAQGRYAEAERYLKKCWDGNRRVLGDDDPDTLMTLLNYANAVNSQGRYAEAEKLDKQCWEGMRRVQGDDHPVTLAAFDNYASAVDEQGRHAESERLFKQSWELRRRTQGEEHPDTLIALSLYANSINDQGRYAEAEPLLKECWLAFGRVLGEDKPETLSALCGYATAINRQRRYTESERLYKQCWERRRRVLGEDHPDTIATLLDCASAVYFQGRFVEAEAMYKRCWETERRVQGEDDPQTLGALIGYTNAVFSQGHYVDAEPLCRQWWQTEKRMHGDDDPHTLMALWNYGNAIDNQGRHADAEPLYKRCWDARRRLLGDNDPDTLEALERYAVSIESQGRFVEAGPLFERCWISLRQNLGEDNPNTLAALVDYGISVKKQDHFADAESLLRQAANSYRRSRPDEGTRGICLNVLFQCLASQKKWPDAELVAREYWAWEKAHPPQGGPSSPASLQLLNMSLVAQGKPQVPTAQASTAPVTQP